LNALATQPITINLHHDGVDPATYSQNANLSSFFNLLSTNVDRKGKPFGSTIEAKHYPFYGIQWHAERNQFEWDTQELVSHIPIAIRTMQYMAR